jgi:hypothetical protein
MDRGRGGRVCHKKRVLCVLGLFAVFVALCVSLCFVVLAAPCVAGFAGWYEVIDGVWAASVVFD